MIINIRRHFNSFVKICQEKIECYTLARKIYKSLIMSELQKKVAIVIGSFHKKEGEMMLEEAKRVAEEKNIEIETVRWVPGSLEKPLAVKQELIKSDIDGAIVLGIIERGETKHGLVMGQAVTQALINLQLEFMKPITFGILGPEILPDQIEPRLLPYAKKAVDAMAEMLNNKE